MIFSIKEVVVKDLRERVLEEATKKLPEKLAENIYNRTTTLSWLNKAQSLDKSEDIELKPIELTILKEIIEHDACQLAIAEKIAILNYIATLKVEVNPVVEVV